LADAFLTTQVTARERIERKKRWKRQKKRDEVKKERD